MEIAEKSDEHIPPSLPPVKDTEDKRDFERHTRIDLPAECFLDQRVDLKIQLTREKPKATQVMSKVKTSLKSGIEIIEIDVQITAQNFAKQEIRQVLTVPIDKDSDEITFTLFPRELGEQLIEIEFFYEASRIGYVIVQTNVKIAPQLMQSNRPAVAFASMQTPMQSFLPSEYSPASPIFMDNPAPIIKDVENISNKNKITLHVSWDEKGGRIIYSIYDNNRTDIGDWKQSVPDIKEYIRERLQELNAFLHEVVVQGNPSEEMWESICFQLQSVGKSLFEDLIPFQVREKSLKWKKEAILLISTNEQWIPWELIFDGTDFWGKKYILARIPRIDESRPISERKRSDQVKNTLSVKKIINVIGGDINDTDVTKAENLFNYLVPPIKLETLKKKPIASLKRALSDADILHLTCHGLLKPHILQIGQDKSAITNISPDSVRNLGFKPGLVVFANACSSTAPVLTFGKFNSFGWEFYRQGTEVFIGTLGAVPTKYAIPFAESVYKELLQKKAEQTVGRAMSIAKQNAEKDRNLFWLLYCIYGDPDFLLEPCDN
jgi:hypothetical protein